MLLVLIYGKFPASFTLLPKWVFISHSAVKPCLAFPLQCRKTCLKNHSLKLLLLNLFPRLLIFIKCQFLDLLSLALTCHPLPLVDSKEKPKMQCFLSWILPQEIKDWNSLCCSSSPIQHATTNHIWVAEAYSPVCTLKTGLLAASETGTIVTIMTENYRKWTVPCEKQLNGFWVTAFLPARQDGQVVKELDQVPVPVEKANRNLRLFSVCLAYFYLSPGILIAQQVTGNGYSVPKNSFILIARMLGRKGN